MVALDHDEARHYGRFAGEWGGVAWRQDWAWLGHRKEVVIFGTPVKPGVPGGQGPSRAIQSGPTTVCATSVLLGL